VGLIVLLLDMSKGIIAVLLAKSIYGSGTMMVVICGLLAILGHVFPIWLKFKGGKGVATAAGVFIALTPISLLIALLVFIVVVVITRYVSLGSIVAALSLLAVNVISIFRQPNKDYALLILVVLIVAMIIYKHKENITRLIRGNENKISFTRKGKA
jgi:glycerol-3-phosphate acyltransferase PlsY